MACWRPAGSRASRKRENTRSELASTALWALFFRGSYSCFGRSGNGKIARMFDAFWYVIVACSGCDHALPCLLSFFGMRSLVFLLPVLQLGYPLARRSAWLCTARAKQGGRQNKLANAKLNPVSKRYSNAKRLVRKGLVGPPALWGGSIRTTNAGKT